jgi:hypothetical protein
VRFIGVLLNSNLDVLDGRFSTYVGDEDQPDEITSGEHSEMFDEDDEEFDVLDRIGPDPEPEGD